VRVPGEAGEGKAKLTLLFPEWKDGNVRPLRVELPLAPRAQVVAPVVPEKK
jgi:hypothetical protein